MRSVEDRTKEWLDYYAGGMPMGVLLPMVWLLGTIMRRPHGLEVRDTLCIIPKRLAAAAW